MAFELPPLPYEKTAFGDLISEETFNYHHGKHHNAYVTKTNDAIKGTDHEGKKLSQIIEAADGGLFNNAAQNARPDYVSALLDNAIDWDFVALNLDGDGVSRADQG